MTVRRTLHALCALWLFTLASSASASLITYGYFGQVGRQAIPDFPIAFGEPVGGFLQYNTDATQVPGPGSEGTYFDPDGVLVASFNNVSLIGFGLQIEVTRVDAGPFFTLARIGFRSDVLFVEGTTEPLDYISLGFTGSDLTALPSLDIPSMISESLNAQLFVASPDIPPVTGMEPPRTGFLTASSLEFFPVATTVPTPGTLWLLCAALLGVMFGATSRYSRGMTHKKALKSATSGLFHCLAPPAGLEPATQ